MIKIDIRADLSRLSERYGLLAKERARAVVPALNKTLTTVRAEASRRMGKEYPGLKIRAIKGQMRFTRATQSSQVAVLKFSNKRFRLFGNFGMRRRGKFGVRLSKAPWRIETGSGDVLDNLDSAFLQRSRRTGVPNVWIRTGSRRYPIEVLVAPSLSEAFVKQSIGAALQKLARDRFLVVLEQQAKFRLSRR